MSRILIVANVAKEHILKFHIPTIKRFSDNGWEVDVACSGEEIIPHCNKQFKMSWTRSPFTFKTITGIKQLKKIVNDGDYDVIYCHTPVGGLVTRIACAGRGKAIVIYCAHGFHFYKGAPIINWILYYPIEKLLSFYTDYLFTVNKEDFILAKRKFKHPEVLLVPEVGVNLKRLSVIDKKRTRLEYREQLRIPLNAKVCIYVAELIKNKNQGMLLKCLAKIRENLPDTYLILAGPDHSNGEFERMAKEIGVNRYVRFLGWRSDIGELMTSADICVASSIREGFGINIVEAMYCGLPVVATNNRGHSMIIKDTVNGYLVPINDYFSMAERVCRLLTNDELYKKFSNVDVLKYDSEEIASELYNIIVNLSKRGRKC